MRQSIGLIPFTVTPSIRSHGKINSRLYYSNVAELKSLHTLLWHWSNILKKKVMLNPMSFTYKTRKREAIVMQIYRKA